MNAWSSLCVSFQKQVSHCPALYTYFGDDNHLCICEEGKTLSPKEGKTFLPKDLVVMERVVSPVGDSRNHCCRQNEE
jgi:hypothetical protein